MKLHSAVRGIVVLAALVPGVLRAMDREVGNLITASRIAEIEALNPDRALTT
ncbi:hypothetical protein [Falsigemmobacter intermedius]|uniref:hypothetical protein n=1 Tax=Falsigemmobacter intermedius TaxID=1553448 RepID=UPI003F1230F7